MHATTTLRVLTFANFGRGVENLDQDGIDEDALLFVFPHHILCHMPWPRSSISRLSCHYFPGLVSESLFSFHMLSLTPINVAPLPSSQCSLISFNIFACFLDMVNLSLKTRVSLHLFL